jgi:hypothetical protein
MQRASVGQITEKGYLQSFLTDNPQLDDVIHYDPTTRIIAIEDPKFLYFLRNLIWSKFARDVGFITTNFKAKYDLALSFAGADRSLAKMLYDSLTEAEAVAFYDKNEQHRILAENVEDYLAPIYRSEAEFIIALLGLDYPKRVWTKFESSQFRQRFGEHSVIAIWFSDVPVGMLRECSIWRFHLRPGYQCGRPGSRDRGVAHEETSRSDGRNRGGPFGGVTRRRSPLGPWPRSVLLSANRPSMQEVLAAVEAQKPHGIILMPLASRFRVARCR